MRKRCESEYETIWSELSEKDKDVLYALALSKTLSGKVEDIRKHLNMTSNSFTTYRSRLLKKGIVHSPEYGRLAFSLPRFKEFAIQQRE